MSVKGWLFLLGDEFRDFARQEFVAIQTSYERICSSRGWT
jgi:hypothetical protein